jgi:hypothetical protein
MSRTYEHYREERTDDEIEKQYYQEQMEHMKETDDISEVPSTEEELFRQILEDERNETA